MTDKDENIHFNILQLASSIEQPKGRHWLIEISRVMNSLGGSSVIPGKIGRSEPSLRRAGSLVIDEPLDDDRRGGALKRLSTVIKENNIQAIVAHDLKVIDTAVSLHSQTKTPLLFVLQQNPIKQGFLAHRKLAKQFKEVDHYISTSQYLGDKLSKDYGVDPDKVTLIYEGLEIKDNNSEDISQERTMSLAHAWGVVEDAADLILIPANYEDPIWRENIVEFAKAIERDQDHNYRCIVVGDDNGVGVLARFEAHLHRLSRGRIQVVGHCADIEAAIKLTSTVLYLHSDEECQFSIALAAQALGRYVFLPKENPCAGEFIENGKTGKLLSKDASEINDEIKNFIANDKHFNRGHFLASRSFIMRYFSKEAMHAQLRDLFENAQLED